jgi:predicted DNA-binding ribbon-helix-helix protein
MTSISLEDQFWTSLKSIAEERHQALNGLVAQINEGRDFANLSSAIRMFVLRYYADKFYGQEPRGLSPTASVGTVDLLVE